MTAELKGEIEWHINNLEKYERVSLIPNKYTTLSSSSEMYH